MNQIGNGSDVRNGTSGQRGRDDLSLIEIASTLARQWRMILGAPIVVALLAGGLTFLQSPRYTAGASFVPQTSDGRQAGGAAALAQQFGVNLGGERAGQSPQFYIDLLRSRAVLRRAVEARYALPVEGDGVREADLIAWYEMKAEGHPLPPWRRAVKELRDNITTSFNRETGVVQFSVTAPHPLLAEQVAARLLQILDEFNTEVRRSRGREESRFIGDRVAETLNELRAAEDALQQFMRRNREFRNSPELLFEYERLQREVGTRQEVHASLVRSWEQARIDAVRDTPLFTVIEHPAGTADRLGRRTATRALLAFMLALMVAVFLAFFRDAARRGRESGDPEYREFQRLMRQTWHDLWRPARWLGRHQRTTIAPGE